MLAIVFTLLMLVFLQIVLGFDNLLYISIESKRVEQSQQKRVRQLGIIIAIALRVVLLFVVFYAIKFLERAFFNFNWEGVIEMKEGCFAKEADGHLKALDMALEQCTGTAAGGEELIVHGGVSGHFLIVLFGGGFILYTAIKEIMHMIALEEVEKNQEEEKRSPGQAIFWIVIMNLVFSFDSILAAIPLTKGLGGEGLQLIIMGIGIVVSGTLMIVLADTVSEFLKKNRMYEVLGLFILFLVGIMLITEAGHLAHLKLFGHEVHAMNKSTFYFVLVVLVLVDVAQSRYQKKLNQKLQK